jgi:lambda repressor-like predicted transcriptional regulator
MRRRRHGVIRNKLDLDNHVQVRTVRRRLKVSKEELVSLVEKAGNSLAGLSKEADLQRMASAPPAEIIASTREAVLDDKSNNAQLATSNLDG